MKASPRRKSLERLGLAIGAGILLGLSFPRFGAWWLCWVALIPFLMALRDCRARQGLWYGWVAGFVTTFIGLGWIYDLVAQFDVVPQPVPLLVLGISSIAHGAQLGVAGLLTAALCRSGVRPIIALPLAITTGELIVPTVFPWMLAVSQHEVLPVVQVADIVGVRGVSTIVALGGATLYEVFFHAREPAARKAIVFATILLSLCLGYGIVRILQVESDRLQSEPLLVGLVQANLTVEEKHDRRRHQLNLSLHQDMSRELQELGAEIVIWPESASPYPIPRRARTDRSGERSIRADLEIPLITGALSIDSRRHERFNSAYLVEPSGGLVGPTDKNELLIFGEYTPLYDELPWIQRRFPNVWNFTAGSEPGVLEYESLRAGILNCYEDVLPHFGRQLANENPNLFVNITNDAWFGNTAEPAQHAAAASFRAIEHRVDLVRAVNSGVSTIVASTGEELARAELGLRRVVLGEIRLQSAGTLYTLWGDLWSWCLVFVALVLLIRAWRLGRKQSRPKNPAESPHRDRSP